MSANNSPITYFCENTSLRGVRRIVTGRTLCLRVAWLVFVGTCSAVLAVNIYQNVRTFARQPSIFVTKMKPLSAEPFPAISFCFQYPFSASGHHLFATGRVPSPYNYSQTVKTAVLNVSTMYAALPYDTYEAYFQNLDIHTLTQITHDASKIFYCVVSLRGGMHLYATETNCALDVTRFWHSSQFACFRLTVPAEYATQAESAVLAIRDVTPEAGDYETHFAHAMPYDSLRPSPGNGIRLAIHDAAKNPDMVGAIGIPSGTSSIIEFSTSVVHRIANGCEVTPTRPSKTVIGFECDSDTFSRQVETACGCLRIIKSIVHEDTDFTRFCLRFDATNVGLSIDKLLCLHKQLQSRERALCVPECKELVYTSIVNSHHINDSDPRYCFVKKLVEHADTVDDNSTILTVIEKVFAGFSAAQCRSSSVVSRVDMSRWITLVASHGHSHITEMVETPVMTLSGLVASIGGAASLWLGLTITVVAELAELLVLTVSQLLEARRKRGRRRETNARLTALCS